MDKSMLAEINRLREMSVADLREEWRRLYREETRSRNRDYLWRRLAWRIQELAHGGLSDRAKGKITDLAPTEFTRRRVPVGFSPETVPSTPTYTPPKTVRDPRLPSPGSTLTREYHGGEIRVLVLDDGFECDGKRYGSLSEVARAITGQHWSGPLFFGLHKRSRRS